MLWNYFVKNTQSAISDSYSTQFRFIVRYYVVEIVERALLRALIHFKSLFDYALVHCSNCNEANVSMKKNKKESCLEGKFTMNIYNK